MHHSTEHGLNGLMNGMLHMGMGAWSLVSVLIVVAIVFALSKRRPK